VYPDVEFDEARVMEEKFTKRSAQRWLFVVLCDLLDESRHSIAENVNHPTLKYGATNQPIELDVYVADLHLAFEYHGLQHYQDTMVFGLAEQYKGTSFSNDRSFQLFYLISTFSVRDDEKRRLCEAAGLTLVEVPYWWDGSHASLATAIARLRPDITLPQQYVQHGIDIPDKKPVKSAEGARKRRKAEGNL
jgi:hypothetical protein